ncbi:type 1 glutamine amidotransferase domain-containing protein [Bacteroides uniformis]|jgi:thiJ/pfpI family protein|uniref:Type 1 glutamine amidotransferase domain-containing protein n=1 Tax=Bacteroides uniformis TaxID=820 RepID=A0A1Y3V3P6_BACUN|nr:type 1 glutamine amidotransferase domain-containing protein [Bacteroides uniformis]KAB4187059.1 type 1 glutamine amidotransferase domain-containing protein [Bacteroides uniformis]MUT99769.1 type 1 glutamine amidotransferase domain-containing protein [Bacteroides uniformis]OUN55731.1 type 1 glutamine amidotransferase domain-containing protein [Bacteroides uniformis]
MKNILVVLTSCGVKGETGIPTGYFMSEVTHPWKVFMNAGYNVDFVSPKGGESPIDTFDLADPINYEFWEKEEWRVKIQHSMSPQMVDSANYCGIFFAGGHGAMWDLAKDKDIAHIAVSIYECGGVVGGVCHGPAGIVNLRLSTGRYLVDGLRVNSFTNEEENIEGTDKVVPFLLESLLRQHGGIFEKSEPWQIHCTSDSRLVTGQNPQSATAVAEAFVCELAKL